MLAISLPAAGGANPALTSVERLREQNASLAARSHAALLNLYSRDAQLARARAQLTVLRGRAAALARERAAVRARLEVAQRALRISQRQLAARVRYLYEQGDADPVAVLLGAGSLDDALARIDALSRAAAMNRSVIVQARSARASLARLTRALAARSSALSRMEANAAETASALERTRTERAGYLAGLAARRALNGRQIASLEAAASAAQAKAQALAAAPAEAAQSVAAPSASAPVTAGERSLTVTATGYSLPGHTATGIPVGWGIVAVDPSVIPLGTRMSIPGYGEGTAADIGSSVQGATIDIWFPTVTQALAWGRRTVTVTLH